MRKGMTVPFISLLLFSYPATAEICSEIRITSDGYPHSLPQWSPDGNWIVFERGDAGGRRQIYKKSVLGMLEKLFTFNLMFLNPIKFKH